MEEEKKDNVITPDESRLLKILDDFKDKVCFDE